MDRFDAMQAFVRVVEAGSFTKAAEALQLSRTRVTQLVQELEARLRVRLLNRSTRRVQPTADGAAYYAQAVRLLAELDEVESRLGGASDMPRGRLRIDVPSPLARLVLVPELPGFHARYPELQLELGASDRLVDLIGANVDCVVRGGELSDPSLVARRVGELQLGVYAAPAYLARAGVPSHPRELAGTHHRVVGYRGARAGRPMSYAMTRGDEQIEVAGQALLTVDDGNAYLAAGLAGIGLLWLPLYMAQAHVEAGELRPVFEDWRLAPMPLYLAYRPNPHVSARLRVFIDWVVALLARRLPR